MHSAKQELSIHSLVVRRTEIDVAFDIGLGLTTVCYLYLLPWCYRRNARFKLWTDGLGLPVPGRRHSAGFALVYLLMLLIGRGRSELVEFAACWYYLLIALYPDNRDAIDGPGRPGKGAMPPGLRGNKNGRHGAFG